MQIGRRSVARLRLFFEASQDNLLDRCRNLRPQFARGIRLRLKDRGERHECCISEKGTPAAQHLVQDHA